MQPHDMKSKLKDEIIAWVTGYNVEGGDYNRIKVVQAFDPHWTLDDLLAETKEGHNALWLAAKVGATEKFLQLVEILNQHDLTLCRAQFYKKDAMGRTILHDAVCIPNNQAILNIILKTVASPIRNVYKHYPPFAEFINTKDDEFGKTALHMAAHYELWENMVMLLNYHADPFIKDDFEAEAFEYIKGKKPSFVTKFMQFLELARIKDQPVKKCEYKRQINEELQQRRDSILANSADACAMIKRYYQDATAKFSLIAQASGREDKQRALKTYQRAYKDYYDSVDQWRQQLVDYQFYYDAYKPFVVENPKKQPVLLRLYRKMFFGGAEKKHPNDHESFLDKMKKRDEKLKADLLALQTPPTKKSATPFRRRFVAA